MLRVVAHQSAAAARQYYAEGLKKEDYYSEGQEVAGKWHGRAVEKLGLSGDVTPEAFAAIVDNRHPLTGERLTPRTKIDRRVGYDLNFHAPKSLSVLEALTGDKRIVAAFREAVAETMSELEERVGTRVRKGGSKGNRVTGNLAWAEFVHHTARPVGGIPDPHLHVHCFAFNATFDQVENRWKAAEFHNIKAEAPYAEAAFHARLAAKITGLGYGVARTKAAWEIAGVPESVVRKFSRRQAQIEELAEEKGITDAREKDALGALTREGKRRGYSREELRSEWKSRLSRDELMAFAAVIKNAQSKTKLPHPSPTEAIDFAFEKCFAKSSVVQQNRLVSEALKFGVGAIKPDEVWRELAGRDFISRKVGDEFLCTTLDVLAEEIALVTFARMGKGKLASFAQGKIAFENAKLSAEQKAAVRHVLTSHDQVICVRGAAGVGKTTLLKEVVSQIEAGGQRVFAFAPSAEASRGTLREEGFVGAETVAHLLSNPRLQQRTRGNVILVDEAGLLGTRELWEIMRIAGDSTRVILTGDSGQHAPVARGDAFRMLQRYSGIRIAEVTEIRRQERELYKSAVTALSRGDLATAFRRLNELGSIVEVQDDGERYRMLAADYLSLSRQGSAPLVVSPTHAESAKVTSAIRDAKKDAGQIRNERRFMQFHNLQWDSADKKRAENYVKGQMVQFHQNAKGIKRGEMFHVARKDEKGTVRLSRQNGSEVLLPLKDAARFQVFEEREISLGQGDQLRITRNGQSADGRRLNNGNVFSIQRFDRQGNIVLSSGATLKANHGHFTYGYCQTSHSSQSKSVRDVLVAQSENSFVASSREQFYVSVSRGKASVKIYTDDRCGLQQAVGNTSIRTAGIELLGLSKRDITAMSTGLNSQQWRDAVRSRVAHDGVKQHLKNILHERRSTEVKADGVTDWRKYVEMRRDIVGPDGKSRSKGHPSPPEKKNGTNLANKRRSFLRPTEHSAEVKKQMKAASEKNVKEQKPDTPAKTPKSSTRAERALSALKSAASHFKKVTGGGKKDQQPKAAKSRMPQSDLQQVAKHAVREKAKRNSESPQQTKNKTPVVRPPTIRK